MTNYAVEIKNVYKRFPLPTGGELEACKNINITLEKGQSLGIVGESGSGKTTLVRMIMKMLPITEGEIYVDGVEIQHMNAEQTKEYRQKIQMVFQDPSAAFNPRMKVKDIILEPLYNFGLLEKGKEEQIAGDYLEMVDLPREFMHRFPHEMSGGQRQRVAMGRAIVRDAKFFLMDEPLSNLDAKLRVTMRAEIAKITRNIGATTIYVTHDQTEAMTLADRIVIMSSTKNPDGSGTIGRIEQIGTPQELYNEPANKFVAGFIGSPAMNFFNVKVDGNRITNSEGLDIAISEGQAKILKETGYQGNEVIFGIRPEDVSSRPIVQEVYPDANVDAEVVVSELLGAETMLYLKLGETEFAARVDARDFHNPGEKVNLTFNVAKGHFFDAETEKRISL